METFETMMREVNRWAYDKPQAGTEEKMQAAFAFLCSEIDELKRRVNAIPAKDWQL